MRKHNTNFASMPTRRLRLAPLPVENAWDPHNLQATFTASQYWRPSLVSGNKLDRQRVDTMPRIGRCREALRQSRVRHTLGL
jgi:hypothetical protein